MEKINLCACIGPLYDEPYCYCEMVRRGLPLNETDRKVAEEELKTMLAEVFQWKKNS